MKTQNQSLYRMVCPFPYQLLPVAIYNTELRATPRFLALYLCVRDQSLYIAHAHKIGKPTLTRLRRTVKRTPDINDLNTAQTSALFVRLPNETRRRG